MYFSNTWSFLVELDNGTVCPVDLSEEEDWNALGRMARRLKGE